MFWQKDIETMKRSDLERLQLERLRYIVDYCYNNVPFYNKRLSQAGITADKIKTLKDIEYIPYTTKDDIRENYPFNMFAVPMKKVARVHASSGTTGKPTVVGYTKKDLDMWSDCVARLCAAAGATEDDIAQISFGYGLFTGALGLHYGLEKLGACVVPVSSGNTQKQIMLMRDFGTTLLISTPSYALYLGEAVKEMGITDLKLRVGLFGGEGCSREIRDQIERTLGLFATDNYGMSEIIGPGVSGECEYRCGMHFAEDHFLPEIIDSESGEVKEKGECGELVVTTLTKEAFPVLRYRTRDITEIYYDTCRCGRTHARMAKVMGRSDDMLIIKGVNVFPTQIESAIEGISHIGPHYQLVVRRVNAKDTLEVKVELIDGELLERYSELEQLTNMIRNRLHSVLGLDAKVTLVEPKSLKRFEGKAQRVLDLRGESLKGEC